MTTPSSPKPKNQKAAESSSSSHDPENHRLLKENQLLKDENARLKEHIRRLEEGAAVVSPCQRLQGDIIAFPSKAVVVSPDSLAPNLKEIWNGLMTETKRGIAFVPSNTPLPPETLAPHLKELLDGLMTKGKEALEADEREDPDQAVDLKKQVFDRVQEAVEEYPILAQVATKRPGEDDYDCLLSICCAMTLNESGHWLFDEEETANNMIAVIKALVELNPYAFVWNPSAMEPIAMGFRRDEFDLFLTIATKISWVFAELPEVSKAKIISSFLDRTLEDELGVWEWDLVTEFFKSQPKMLEIEFEGRRTEQYPDPLHFLIEKLAEVPLESDCTAPSGALINLMVQEFPAALLKQDEDGDTPLHIVFINLKGARVVEEPLAKKMYHRICISAGKILLKGNPSALLLKNQDDLTPLEYLDKRLLAHEPVRAFVVEALREYYPRELTPQMKEVPFLQQAYDLLQQEAAFARNSVQLKVVSAIIAKIENERGSDSSDDSKEKKDVTYSDWAKVQLIALSTKIETIQETDIPAMGTRFDGSESESESDGNESYESESDESDGSESDGTEEI